MASSRSAISTCGLPLRAARRGPSFLSVEAVHLHQELVQGLLPLVVAPQGIRPASLAQGIQLVHENDAGCLLLRLGEEIPDPGAPPGGPLGDATTQALDLLRVLEELHHLLELLPGLVHAGHIVEGDADLALGVDLGPVSPDAAQRQHPLARAELLEHDPPDDLGNQSGAPRR